MSDQERWNHELAANVVEFTDDEDEVDKDGNFNFRSAAMYLEKPKVKKKKDGRILAVVDKSNYYKAIESNRPDTQKAKRLKQKRGQCQILLKKHIEEQQDNYGDD